MGAKVAVSLRQAYSHMLELATLYFWLDFGISINEPGWDLKTRESRLNQDLMLV